VSSHTQDPCHLPGPQPRQRRNKATISCNYNDIFQVQYCFPTSDDVDCPQQDPRRLAQHRARPAYTTFLRSKGRADRIRCEYPSTMPRSRIRAQSLETVSGEITCHFKQINTSKQTPANFLKSGKSIFLRSIDDPSLSKQYTSHTSGTTVSRFSPSGYYVASGDVSGSVMVWDAVEGVNTKGMGGSHHSKNLND
jgi:hypothetical protein